MKECRLNSREIKKKNFKEIMTKDAGNTIDSFLIEPVSSESEEAWSGFLKSLTSRGLGHPLLVISDGSKGLIKAITGSFPLSQRQRCVAHKLRNIISKVPQQYHDEILTNIREVYYAPDIPTAEKLANDILNSYSDILPSMVKCFLDDLE